MRLYSTLVAKLLFPLHEQLKRHDTTRILRDLERTQWLSADELRALQASRLRELLSRAGARVPYYKKLLDAGRTAGPDADPRRVLAALPIIDKATIRAHYDDWAASGARGLIRLQTSGSSGEPLHFKVSRHRISFDIAAKWRAMRWWGVELGDRELVCWNSPLETDAQDRIRKLRDTVFRSRLVPTRELGTPQLDAVLDEIRAFRPRMLFGYPSALAQLARRALDRRLDLRDAGIRVAFCTSEVLHPEWRAAIGSAFHCGVANEYGARDAGFIARECPEGRLHITAEEVIVEVVDDAGNPVPDGAEGEILVTNLAGPEFPFIRYRTGDRGRLSAAQCACGRGLPVLDEICGRSNDGLVSETGAWVHGSAVNHWMREIPGLRAYRIVQDAPRALEILLALDAPLPEVRSTELIGHVRSVLGAGFTVKLTNVDEIPPLANGKFRHIICNVDRHAPSEPSLSGATSDA